MEQIEVVNPNGVKVIVKDWEELEEIAGHWVNEYNQNTPEGEEGWQYPESQEDVEEILTEYMECEISEAFVTSGDKYNELMYGK